MVICGWFAFPKRRTNRNLFRAYTAESRVVQAGIGAGTHAPGIPVAGAVVVIAEKRPAPDDFFLQKRHKRVVRAAGSLCIGPAGFFRTVIVKIEPIAAPLPNVAGHVVQAQSISVLLTHDSSVVAWLSDDIGVIFAFDLCYFAVGIFTSPRKMVC